MARATFDHCIRTRTIRVIVSPSVSKMNESSPPAPAVGGWLHPRHDAHLDGEETFHFSGRQSQEKAKRRRRVGSRPVAGLCRRNTYVAYLRGMRCPAQGFPEGSVPADHLDEDAVGGEFAHGTMDEIAVCG